MSALLYINDAEKYPVSLALKLFADPGLLLIMGQCLPWQHFL